MTSRRSWRARGSGLVAVAALLAGSLVACGQTREPTVPADAEGALFGAYVSPARFIDSFRMSAVETFESRLGRQLGIIMTYHPFEDEFPSDIDRWVLERGDVLLLSWGGTETSAIVGGEHDDLIRDRARAMAKLEGNVLFRWRWEMNRPNLRAEIPTPEDYISAWKHIREIFDEEGAQIDWVWCPLARDFDETEGPAFYPGDDQVEWLCVDAYAPDPTVPLEEVMQPFMRFAAEHADKPIVIGEFATRAGSPGERAAWLDEAMDYLSTAQGVRAVVYYESDRAPSGDFALINEPDSMEVFTRWGQHPHFNPSWDGSD